MMDLFGDFRLHEFDLGMVALSWVVAAFGALSAFSTARGIVMDGRTHPGWLLLSALILGGCTAWAAYFTGLMALTAGEPVAFDISLTLAAFLIPVIAFIPGMYLAWRWGHIPGMLPIGAVFLGVGLAGMNHISADVLRVDGRIVHDEFFLLAGTSAAVLITILAVFLARSPRALLRYLAAGIMGLAIPVMYVISFGGLEIVPTEEAVDYFTNAIAPQLMLGLIAVTVLFFALMGLGLGLSQEQDRQPAAAPEGDRSEEIAQARAEIQRRREALRERQ